MSKYLYRGIMLMLLLVLFFLFRNEHPALETLANYASFIILVIGVGLIWIWLTSDYSQFLNSSIKTVYWFWIFMLGWFVFVPVFFFDGSTQRSFYEGMYHDYRYLLFSLLPFFFIGNRFQKYYHKIFDNVGTVGVLSGIIALVLVDKSFDSVASREGAWTLSYYLWWVVICIYPYLFLKHMYIKKDKKGLALMIMHLTLSIFFLKRSGFVSALFILFLVFMISGTASKFLKLSLAGAFFSVLFLFVAGDYISLLLLRFEMDAANFQQFDRNLEVEEFLSVASTSELLTGFGMNNYIKMTYIGQEDRGVNALHIGFFNLIYKGGVFYVVFFLFLASKIMALRKYIKFNNEIKVGFILGLTYLLGFAFENSWSYVPINFFLLLPIYRAIYLKGEFDKASAHL